MGGPSSPTGAWSPAFNAIIGECATAWRSGKPDVAAAAARKTETGSRRGKRGKKARTDEPAVARFFKEIFVMAEDSSLREARLMVMKRLEQLILQLGDISEIVSAES